MATTNNEKTYPIKSFDRGMQRTTTKFLPEANDLFFGKNIDLQKVLGGITKALGYTQKGVDINSSANILGAGALNTSAGVNKLLAFSGTDAYVFDGSSAWAAQSRTFTASQSFEVENFLDMLFMVNGLTDAPQSYTGAAWSTTTNVTDMPKAKYIRETAGRLFLGNINVPIGGSFPSRVWYSNIPVNNAITWDFESGTDLATTASSGVVTSAAGLFKTRGIKVGDPFFIAEGSDIGQYTVLSIDSETQITLTVNLTATATNLDFWVGGNWFDVARDNSDVIMGLGRNSDRLLCFKRYSVHKFQKTNNDETDSLLPIRGIPGTTSHRSIANIKEWTFWVSDNGIWRFDGASGLLISYPVQEIWDGVTAANKLSAVSWTKDDRILKTYVGNVSNSDTGLTISNCVICYDTYLDQFWVDSIPDIIRCAVVWIDSNVKKTFIFSSTGECEDTSTGDTFDGVNVDMDFETWPHFPISPEVAVNITRIRLYGIKIQSAKPQYKLYYEDGKIDADWQNADITDKTEHEIEIGMKLSEKKACGVSLRGTEDSSNIRPTIERGVIYYSDAVLR